MKAFLTQRAVAGILTAALAMAALLNLFQYEKVHALESQVSAVSQKAFFETVTLMDGIGSNLEKMLISVDDAKEQSLLGDISRQADAAQGNLALLSTSLPAVDGALKFVNQIGDYASGLSDHLSVGGSIGEEDRELLTTLLTGCEELIGALSTLSVQIQQGENPLAVDPSLHQIALPLNNQTGPSIEYPSLLYDGPFSDGRAVGQLKLGTVEYSAEEALAQARRFIGEERVLSARITGEGRTPVPCYEIEATVAEGELSLALTRQGGQVVYMLCADAPGAARFSQAELIDLAASFLKSRGYPHSAVSYWFYDDQLLTVNFAAMQDGVILYPDLIKVQMNAETGLPVGFEALNYLANHQTRAGLSPTLDADEAAARLSPLITVQSARLCVIPTDSGEALCYEFSGGVNGNRYLIYIDAHTGAEREIYRILENESGYLAV